jgi:hypothetical protein
VSKELKKIYGVDFIFGWANLEGNEQKALTDATPDQCVRHKKYRI